MGNNKTLVLGIGNILLGDEGIGCHVVTKLKDMGEFENVDIIDGGTGGFHLLSLFEDYPKIIIIDATMDKQAIGAVSIIKPKFASDFPTALSAHDIGLRDLIETAILSKGLPEIVLITVTIKEIQNMVVTLSPEIEAVVPTVIEKIEYLLKVEQLPV